VNYTALAAVWPANVTIAQGLAEVNALQATVDVTAPQITGYLLLSGVYPVLAAFAQTAASGNATHDAALNAAKVLMAFLTLPDPPVLRLSQRAAYLQVQTMASAIVAQETAVPGSTAFTQTVMNGLMALAQTNNSWRASAGYGPQPFTAADVQGAGLSFLPDPITLATVEAADVLRGHATT
jgi:hypothetical protein